MDINRWALAVSGRARVVLWRYFVRPAIGLWSSTWHERKTLISYAGVLCDLTLREEAPEKERKKALRHNQRSAAIYFYKNGGMRLWMLGLLITLVVRAPLVCASVLAISVFAPIVAISYLLALALRFVVPGI